MLDGTIKILLVESGGKESSKGAAIISYVVGVSGVGVNQPSENQKNVMLIGVFVGYVCRLCRKGLCLLVLGGVRYAKH